MISTNFETTPGQTDFTFAFPYLSKTDLSVLVDGVLTSDWTLINPQTVQLGVSVTITGDEVVTVSRSTPIDQPAATFASPGTLRASEMNVAISQLLYNLQEQDQTTKASLNKAETNLDWDGEGLPLKNLAAGEDPTDAATLGDIDAAITASGNMPGFSVADAGRVLTVTSNAASVWANPGPGISTFKFAADPAPVAFADGGYHIPTGAPGSTSRAGLGSIGTWTTVPIIADEAIAPFFGVTAPTISGDYIRIHDAGLYEIEAVFQVRSIPAGNVGQTSCAFALCDEFGTSVYAAQVNITLGQSLQLSTSVTLKGFINATGGMNVALKATKVNDNDVVLELPSKIVVRQVR